MQFLFRIAFTSVDVRSLVFYFVAHNVHCCRRSPSLATAIALFCDAIDDVAIGACRIAAAIPTKLLNAEFSSNRHIYVLRN